MRWFKQQRAERHAPRRRGGSIFEKFNGSVMPLFQIGGRSDSDEPSSEDKPKTARKKPSRWRWNGFEVEAFTKTEARGKLKRLAGLKRLPVGAVVEKMTGDGE